MSLLTQSSQNHTRVDAICPIFADTAIVTEHEDIKKAALAMGPLLTVERVVEAFTTLANSPGSGRVLVVLRDMPFIHWPNKVIFILRLLNCYVCHCKVVRVP